MEKVISYGVIVRDEGDYISIIQKEDEDFNVHISVEEVDLLCNALKNLRDEKINTHSAIELPSERESSAKEKEFPSFDTMLPVGE